MTEEEKIVVENKKECHCECGKILTKFLLNITSVFLGVLLAILVASALLKPQAPCPCKMGMWHQPGIDRQMPPFGMHGQRPHMHKFHGKDFKKFDKLQKPNFNADDKD